MQPPLPRNVLDLHELHNRLDRLYADALAAIRESSLTAPQRFEVRIALNEKLWAAEEPEQIVALCDELEATIRQYRAEEVSEDVPGSI